MREKVTTLVSDFLVDGKHELRIVALRLVEGKPPLLIGTASVTGIDSEVATLYQVFVGEDWRRQGVGALMVGEACWEAAARGAKAASALVSEENSGARAFWESLGFAPVHLEKPLLVLGRALKPGGPKVGSRRER